MFKHDLVNNLLNLAVGGGASVDTVNEIKSTNLKTVNSIISSSFFSLQ